MLTMQDNSGNKVVEVFDSRYDKDVLFLSSHLRDADFDEIFDVTGESPHITVIKGWEMALRRFIIFNSSGSTVAVFGIRPETPFSKIGVVWLLGTEGLDRIKKFFVKISKPMIKEMAQGFDLIFGFVDSRYEKSKRWLEWCGFTLEPAIGIGINDIPFHRFYMEID